MNRTPAQLALDREEFSLLQQMDGATLDKVADVKRIFGQKSRVVEYREPPNLEEIFDSFFVPLFAKTKGNIEIRCFPSRSQLFSRDKKEITSFIKAHLHENVFFGVCTRRDRDGSKRGVLEVPAIWADVDFKDYPGGELEAREVVRNFPRKPSMVVMSGHGAHLYWILRQPVAASMEIEGYLKGITKALRADPAAAELARVLRVPGTFNHKDGGKVLATLRKDNGARYE